ncbi:uncharacterized protein [Nicotiana tomentosiformis]|uniref:uncharacterized protein n=1 Tax=Nicotiana tomentosiformis TaxID=4098 RepID=UPI00388C88D8
MPANSSYNGYSGDQWGLIYYFSTDRAAFRWSRQVGAAPFSWNEFSIFFFEKFVPQTRREELCRQFEQLYQEDMSVTQYEMRFSDLARHAVWLVPFEREKIRRFINGLNQQFCFVMTLRNEREEKEAKRSRGPGNSGGVPSGGQSYHIRGRPYRPAQMARLAHHGASASHGSYSARPSQSSLSALPAQSSSRAPSVQGSSVPGYSGSRGPPQYLPTFSVRGCFECGELGHMKR